MSKVSCDIVQDLLPLYYDDVCSEDSKKMVEKHLLFCDSCQKELDRIQDEIEIPREAIEKYRNDSKVIQNIKTLWNRSRVKSFVKGIMISSIIFSLLFFGYHLLFHWNITNVPTNVAKVTQVSKLADGKIVFHVELTDGYALNEIVYDMDQDGNFYMTPLRPIIKKKEQPPGGLANGYDFMDIEDLEEAYDGREIKALYYGTPEDKILIWKKGMNLPPASKEVENMFKFE